MVQKKKNKNEKVMKYLHERMRAKLFGYTKSLPQVLQRYHTTDKSEFALYARAFGYFQATQLDKALNEINQLLLIKPNDPFYLESKADILFRMADFQSAIDAYEQVLKQIPWSGLVHFSLARALIQQKENTDYDYAIKILKQALSYEPSLSGAWQQLSIAYGKQNKIAHADLAKAEEALLYGDTARAIGLAKRAVNKLEIRSPEWVRARDIILQLDNK